MQKKAAVTTAAHVKQSRLNLTVFITDFVANEEIRAKRIESFATKGSVRY